MARTEVEQEVEIFSAWRDSALALGLENAAVILMDEINNRKEALTKTDPQTPASEQRDFLLKVKR